MLRGWTLRLFGMSREAGRAGQDADQEVVGEAGEGDDEPAPWVPALTVFNVAQATIASARLQDEGIPVRLRQEAVSSALPLTVGIVGRIDVMVPEPMLEKALPILEAQVADGDDLDKDEIDM